MQKQIKLKNIEIYKLIEELYGKHAVDKDGNARLVVPGLLNQELGGIPRRRLSRTGVKLKAEHKQLEDIKEEVLKKYATENPEKRGSYTFNGEKDSPEQKKNSEDFAAEFEKILQDETTIEVDMISEDMLPKCNQDYELAFTKLVIE